MLTDLPIIDIHALLVTAPDDKQRRLQQQAAESIHRACRDTGFFYISGYGLSGAIEAELEALTKEFFALPEDEKMRINMRLGGRAWRGYFPVGKELTSGQPDWKEGIYFGSELGSDHPAVLAGLPMHGANLFPSTPARLREVVLDYIEQVTRIGHALMRGLALSLGIDGEYFARDLTKDPLLLFRIFHYPPPSDHHKAKLWGVGEHTDYGVLTILKQDMKGGLEVKTSQGWRAAPPITGTLVCNIGDMLDRLTFGYYRSTPHRVRNVSGNSRYSWPFFFDPCFSAQVKPVDFPGRPALSDDQAQRWDKQSVHAFQGTYGEYILGKVAKVFPELGATHIAVNK